MKLLIPLLIMALKGSVQAQVAVPAAATGTVANLAIPEKDTKPTGPLFANDALVKSKSFKFGLGVGPSVNLTKTYSYTLRAPDYALTRQAESRAAFVLSGVVAYNKSVYYRHLDDNGNPEGEPYARPYPLSALLSLNIAEFTNTGNAFNRRIDGGIGVGIRFSEDFHVGFFLEATSRRFLYSDYEQYINKPLPSFVANQAMTALDLNSDTYFTSKPVFSLTFKLVYIFSDELPAAKTPADALAAAAKK